MIVSCVYLGRGTGPIIAQREFDVDDQTKATQLLDVLFKIGADMLIENVSAIASGEAGEFAMASGSQGIHLYLFECLIFWCNSSMCVYIYMSTAPGRQ